MSLSRRAAHLAKVLTRLLSGPKVGFADAEGIPMARSTIPATRGLYLVVDFVERDGVPLLVGSGNLMERVYKNQFQGEKASRAKRVIVKLGRARKMSTAKQYLMECCLVQYLEVNVEDNELQWYEDYVKAMLQPLSPG